MQTDILNAVTVLKQGGLVAFPTETVYGLGADAKNSEAIAQIFQAKGRPGDHPLIVHIADMNQLSSWVSDISDKAKKLAEQFWPGPMTLIFKKAPGVLDIITGGQDTIGIRIPQHPIAQALLTAFGGGVAAPSANRFGRISPTTADAVFEELGSSVQYILDGGQCTVGVESTIIDVSGETPVILRPGMLGKKAIEEVLQCDVLTSQANAPRVSGSHDQHYAPNTQTQLIDGKDIPYFLEKLQAEDLPLALVLVKTKLLPRERIDCFNLSTTPEEYAHDLYQTLRMLDKQGYKRIMIESVPVGEIWDAIRDRLTRASSGVFMRPDKAY